jgi:hypothetical protein
MNQMEELRTKPPRLVRGKVRELRWLRDQAARGELFQLLLFCWDCELALYTVDLGVGGRFLWTHRLHDAGMQDRFTGAVPGSEAWPMYAHIYLGQPYPQQEQDNRKEG